MLFLLSYNLLKTYQIVFHRLSIYIKCVKWHDFGVDSITRENRLNLLLTVLIKTHNEAVDILYAQGQAQKLRDKYNLIFDLLLDNDRVIPAVILLEGKDLITC